MRRFGKYIITALITFTFGLSCSFLTGGHWFSSKGIKTGCAAARVVETRSPKIVSSVAGDGLTSDGFENSFSEYQYSDGTYLHRYHAFYISPNRAEAELVNHLQEAFEILRQEFVLDEEERQIGRRVVAVFPPQPGSDATRAELLWTEHGNFFVRKRNTLESVLEDYDSMR